AVESALPDDLDDGVVVLPIDERRRSRVAFVFRGGWPGDLTPLVDVLLDGATGGDVAAVAIALVRPDDDWPAALSAHDLAPWRVAVDRLRAGGVELTSFLVLGGDTW